MKQNSKIFSDRSGSRDRSESPRRRSRSRSTEIAEQLCRLHICNFDESIKKNDIEDAFSYVFYSFNNKLVAFFSYQTNFDLKYLIEICCKFLVKSFLKKNQNDSETEVLK